MTTEVSNVAGHLSNTLIFVHRRLSPGCWAERKRHGEAPPALDVVRAPFSRTSLGIGGGDVREKVRASDEDRYCFFFVKAGPKSGFTWQFSTLPTHIESS